jgi:hypothetical protein
LQPADSGYNAAILNISPLVSANALIHNHVLPAEGISMLAILYLLVLTWFGDGLCRRFYRFSSPQHRWATAFLVGLLLSSWITYLGALSFAWTGHALLAGNITFFLTAVLAARFLPPRLTSAYLDVPTSRPPGNDRYDVYCLLAFFLFGGWLMLATLNFRNGNFVFGFKSWSDFGANLSLAQSFILGNNFPSEHPFFPGVTLRYHFLFWFQTANLSYLGLNLAWSVNLLSILSLMAMLIMLVAFAETLFQSRVTGRLAATFFFLASSSLAYLPLLRKQGSLSEAWRAISQRVQFLETGYPYRGEDWGALTVDVFANQRHLISAVGLLLVALIYLLDRYQFQIEQPRAADFRDEFGALFFTGALIGLLPYWNSAVFVAGMIVLGSVWLCFPYRRAHLICIGTAILLGLPQVLLLKSGELAQTGESLFHFGYTIQNPTVMLVLQYLGWTFGFKWLLLLVALWLASGTQRRFLLAVTVLLPVVFLLKLSTDVFNNHKLLNLWNLFATTYAAYALWRIGKNGIPQTMLACALALLMVFSSIIELFPIHNDAAITIPFNNDRLVTWVSQNTQPSDIFLTHNFLAHPILFAGRKVYLGYTLFAWTAGYNVGAREAVYVRMFEERNPLVLMRLLQDNKIAYVGIDNSVRRHHLVKNLNEEVYQQHFQKVFEDTENKYEKLTIYKVR